MFSFSLYPFLDRLCGCHFSGLGYGLVPDYQIADRIQNGTLIEILPQCSCDVPLYWHHWKQQSPALKQLTKVILEQAEQCMNSPIQ